MLDGAATSYLAGIDIGGTNLRCALALPDDPTRLLVRTSTATPSTQPVGAFVASATTLVRECLRNVGAGAEDLLGIGCTAPGITDPRRGLVRLSMNLGWEDVPLAECLADRLGCPVVLENDVNAAALAEHRHGAGRGADSLVFFTVSTGVAAGLLLNGEIWHGHRFAAGEMSYVLAEPPVTAPALTLEDGASGAGLARAWSRRPDGAAVNAPATAADVFEAARRGDDEGHALVARAAACVAQATVALAAILDPACIIFGGGIAQHEGVVLERVRAFLPAALPTPPRVELAHLGEDAPLVGALTLAHERFGRAPARAPVPRGPLASLAHPPSAR